MRDLLIYFTSSYPNSSGEVFVENEIRVLENYFSKIKIISSTGRQNEISRYTPNNTEVFVFNENLSFSQKLQGVRFLFNKVFWQEIAFARKTLQIKFKFIHFKILYIDLTKGYLLSKYVEKICKDQPSETTYYYAYWSDYKAVACTFLKKRNPLSIAFARSHRWDIYLYANLHKYLPLRKFIFDHLDAVFCIAQDGIEYLKRELKLSDKNMYLARLGTFNDQTAPLPYKERSSFTIVSCSNLIPVKRVHLIVEALSLVNTFEIEWIHFGDGPLKDSLTKLAEKKLRGSNVSFTFMGALPNDQIISFYRDQQVDLFINVSESEGIPVSIMEAMSFGIPVMATAVGGTPEILTQGVNGILLSENISAEEIAGNITRFLQYTPEEKQEFRQNAYNTWAENYNAEKNYKSFVDTIFSLKR
jgi:colanic acid/amylovoran biosynthesis glycosyltransferase